MHIKAPKYLGAETVGKNIPIGQPEDLSWGGVGKKIVADTSKSFFDYLLARPNDTVNITSDAPKEKSSPVWIPVLAGVAGVVGLVYLVGRK